MPSYQLPDGLSELVFASLLGTGELSYNQGNFQCMFLLEKEKYLILDRYIYQYQLHDYITQKRKRGQFFIHIPQVFRPVYNEWYDHLDKKKVNDKDITPYIALLSILLFASRKVKPIELRSTIHNKYTHAVAFHLERLFNVYIDPSMNGFNIHDPIKLFFETTKYFSLEEMNEFMKLLTKHETKQVSKTLHDYKRQYVL